MLRQALSILVAASGLSACAWGYDGYYGPGYVAPAPYYAPAPAYYYRPAPVVYAAPAVVYKPVNLENLAPTRA